MKRLIAAALVLIFAAVLFGGCAGQDADAGKVIDMDAVLDSISDRYPDMDWDGFTFYYSSDDEYAVDDSYASYLFNRDYDHEDALRGYDYAMIISGGKEVFEVMILKGPDLQGMLDRRLEMKQDATLASYMPEQYDILKGTETFIRGQYGFLLTTPDNQAAKDVIDAAFGN